MSDLCYRNDTTSLDHLIPYKVFFYYYATTVATLWQKKDQLLNIASLLCAVAGFKS